MISLNLRERIKLFMYKRQFVELESSYLAFDDSQKAEKDRIIKMIEALLVLVDGLGELGGELKDRIGTFLLRHGKIVRPFDFRSIADQIQSRENKVVVTIQPMHNPTLRMKVRRNSKMDGLMKNATPEIKHLRRRDK